MTLDTQLPLWPFVVVGCVYVALIVMFVIKQYRQRARIVALRKER